MKLEYFPETDTLYIQLADRPSVEGEEIADDVIASFDAGGMIVGLTIEQAAIRMDLSSLEALGLPVRA